MLKNKIFRVVAAEERDSFTKNWEAYGPFAGPQEDRGEAENTDSSPAIRAGAVLLYNVEDFHRRNWNCWKNCSGNMGYMKNEPWLSIKPFPFFCMLAASDADGFISNSTNVSLGLGSSKNFQQGTDYHSHICQKQTESKSRG